MECEHLNRDGIIITVDLEKAFDLIWASRILFKNVYKS